MNPHISVAEAAKFLNITTQAVHHKIKKHNLVTQKIHNKVCFSHETARLVFEHSFSSPMIKAIQIVKGGTGKSTMSFHLAVRASLYGARVLCIDLDQQANLTSLFRVRSENIHSMFNILNDSQNVPLEKGIINIQPGIDLMPSNLENAALDDVLLVKGLPLERIYKDLIETIKDSYDLILLDCPPALGRSVAAAAFASDEVIAPVIPEKLCLRGLELLHNSLDSLSKRKYAHRIPYRILFNRFNARTTLSKSILASLMNHPIFRDKTLSTYVRHSQEFPNVSAAGYSLFESSKLSPAKEDIDALTQEILFPNLLKNTKNNHA